MPYRRTVAWAPLVALLLGAGGPAVADPDGPPPLEVRIHRVHALTRGLPSFQADRGPRPPRADSVNDEMAPLYGGELPEPTLPVGTVGDLIERVQAGVGAPAAWEREGVALSPLGDADLVLVAPADLQARVAARLDEEARRALATVTLDVAALTGDPTAARGPQGLAGAVASRALRPVGLARVVVPPGARGAARDGAVRAYLGDVAVEVAEDSRVSDPVVHVLPTGIAVQARAMLAGSRVTAHVLAWWAAPEASVAYRTAQGDVLELPSVDGRLLDTTLDLTEGVWSFAPGGGGVLWAVRATVSRPDVQGAGSPAALGPPSLPPLEASRVVPRTFDVADLLAPVPEVRGIRVGVSPTGWTVPKSAEPREPRPVIGGDALVELLRAAIDRPSWEQGESVSLDLRGAHLFARTDAPRQEAIGRLLDRLREDRLRTLRARLLLLALPIASFPEWWTGLDDGLWADGGAGLLARAGARRIEEAEVVLLDGARGVSLGGARRLYTADYDVEIAQGISMADPITATLFEGTSFDVEVASLPGGGRVAVTLRLDHGRVLRMDTPTTAHGTLQAPVYGLWRAHGGFVVPLGAARLVGASAAGGEVTLALVSVTPQERR